MSDKQLKRVYRVSSVSKYVERILLDMECVGPDCCPEEYAVHLSAYIDSNMT